MPLNQEQRKLVEANMGLIATVIKENVKNIHLIGLFTYGDIFQIGCIGLSKAAEKYEPGRGKFCTYAYVAIRNEIFNALEYATVRRNGEVIIETDAIRSRMQECDEFARASSELDEALIRAKSRANGVVAKGIDAIRLIANGYNCREIGELMGGASANNVTAWVSKARAFLKNEPDILAFRGSI